MINFFSFFRSGTSHRLRIAFNLKDIPYELKTVDLRAAEHKDEKFLQLNPQGLVPVVNFEEDGILTQTPAIIEYLDEKWPENKLFPSEIFERTKARAMASIIGCDIHPINNLRILKTLKNDFNADDAAINKWCSEWINDGFNALEKMLPNSVLSSGFSFGEAPGVIECYLIPQVLSSERFGVDLTPYPKITALYERCKPLTAFKNAHPLAQPDAM